MTLLAENDLVISYFSGNLNILSGSLLKVEIYSEADTLIVDLVLKLLYSQKSPLYRLRFLDVKEYAFYHSSEHIFYNISNYKFLRGDEFFYLSLDPEDEKASRSKNDNDFILSKAVQVYLMSLSE